MDSKCTALSGLALDGEAAVHRLNDGARQRKAESCAVDVGARDLRAAVKGLEDLFDLLRRDSNAAIFHGDLNFTDCASFTESRSANAEPAFIAAVLYGIGDQVLKGLGERRKVSGHFGQPGFHAPLHLHLGCRYDCCRIFERGINHLADVDGTQVVLAHLLLRAGKEQHLFDQLRELPRLMERFRANVARDLAGDSELRTVLDPKYTRAFLELT